MTSLTGSHIVRQYARVLLGTTSRRSRSQERRGVLPTQGQTQAGERESRPRAFDRAQRGTSSRSSRTAGTETYQPGTRSESCPPGVCESPGSQRGVVDVESSNARRLAAGKCGGDRTPRHVRGLQAGPRQTAGATKESEPGGGRDSTRQKCAFLQASTSPARSDPLDGRALRHGRSRGLRRQEGSTHQPQGRRARVRTAPEQGGLRPQAQSCNRTAMLQCGRWALALPPTNEVRRETYPRWITTHMWGDTYITTRAPG